MTLSDALMEVEVAARHIAADGIIVLELIPVGATTLPRFEPGAHVDVAIAPGLVRQYSLCSDPASLDRYRLGILLEPASRGGSAAVHASFHVGERIRIGRPRNNFPLADDPAPAILIGGGIGITPLLAMAHHLHATQRPFTLHYCARSRDRAAFLDELQTAPYATAVRLHFDDGDPAQRLDPARDLPAAAIGAHLYLCGPTGFMDWLIAAARATGFPEPRIHREYFAATPDTGGGAFEVELAKSARTVAVAPGQSIVTALRDIGIRVNVSCEQGVCGTCLCDVLEGIPDHRDSYLTDDEKRRNDQMTLCCSRALTPRLVIDL